MDTKHTPGPWTRTEGERFKHDRGAGVKAASDQYIAAALDRNRYDLDEEVEANARLIAAAPELLVAVKSFMYHFESELGEKWRLETEQLIAKANGNVD